MKFCSCKVSEPRIIRNLPLRSSYHPQSTFASRSSWRTASWAPSAPPQWPQLLALASGRLPNSSCSSGMSPGRPELCLSQHWVASPWRALCWWRRQHTWERRQLRWRRFSWLSRLVLGSRYATAPWLVSLHSSVCIEANRSEWVVRLSDDLLYRRSPDLDMQLQTQILDHFSFHLHSILSLVLSRANATLLDRFCIRSV